MLNRNIPTKVCTYRHSVATGRIANTNPVAKSAISEIVDFSLAFSAATRDRDTSKDMRSSTFLGPEGVMYYEFFFEVYSSDSNTDLFDLNEILASYFDGDQLNHSDTYAVVCFDGAEYTDILVFAYGSVKENFVEMGKGELKDLHFSTPHPVVTFVTLPESEWKDVLETEDVERFIRSVNAVDSCKEYFSFIYKMKEFLGDAFIPDNDEESTSPYFFSYLKLEDTGAPEKSDIVIGMTSLRLLNSEKSLVKCQEKGNDVLIPLGGNIRYVLAGNTHEALGVCRETGDPALCQFKTNGMGEITDYTFHVLSPAVKQSDIIR